MHFAELAASKVLGMGDICDIEERSGRFFGLRRVGPPVLPTPNELLTKGFPFGFFMESVGGGAAYRGPGDEDPQIDAGAHPLFLGGYCLDGGESLVGCLSILGV